jgi:hypothetical protein
LATCGHDSRRALHDEATVKGKWQKAKGKWQKAEGKRKGHGNKAKN